MLRTRLFIVLYLIGTITSFVAFLSSSSSSTMLLRRVTETGEEVMNLNPSLSGDGRIVVFESTANLASTGPGTGFRAILADLATSPAAFAQMGISRAVAPAISQDGSRVAFASHEDPLGANVDRNSEIFLFEGGTLRQITNTTPVDNTSRIHDGNFQPSITDDGRLIAFASNRNLAEQNADQNFEIVVYDAVINGFVQLTDSQGIFGATDAKISGDGSRVAFIRDASQGHATSRDLLLHERATGSTAVLTTNQISLSMTYGRAISDDGLRIVYSSESVDNRNQVFLFDGRSNITRQITSLEARAQDVPLHPSISGDGKRITFATRRNPLRGNADHSVELFLFDLPTGQLTQLTDSPSSATAEVVSSLNDDGSVVVFNFPRVLSGAVSNKEVADNSEIYLRQIEPRPGFGNLELLNGASLDTEPSDRALAPESIAIARGSALAHKTEQAVASVDGSFPTSLAGTRIEVNQRAAKLLYVSPTQVHFVVPTETEIGFAEVILTNSEGFQSRTSVNIIPSAPGVFTWNGQGDGAGAILNADNLFAGPFDPTDGQLRLLVFATGARGSSQLSATILGRPVTLESIQRSPSLPGLDEIHLFVPSELRGSGTVTITLIADNRESNPVEVTFQGNFQRDVLINELLADPPDGLAGDANRDGERDSSQDEFIELINTTERDIDLSGYQLQTRGTSGTTDILRHRFAVGTVLPAGTALVVFGGGIVNPANDVFGGAQIQKASTGGLSLVNSGGLVTLRNATGTTVTFMAYGGSTGLRGDANQSLTRAPDVTGSFVLHQSDPQSEGSLFSPGTRLNGEPFLPFPLISQILLTPNSAVLNVGDDLRFSASAFDQNNRQLTGVLFGWKSNNVAIATVDANGLAKAISAGSTQITATARGTQSAPAILTVASRAPSPLPSPSPTPTVTPTPSPTPPPTPTTPPRVLISEFRTRGPNGASDEFVELYNNSDGPISIGGWKVRGSSTSGGITTRLTVAPGTLLPAHGHFLATNSTGYSGSVAGDQSYSSGIANDGGISVTLPDDSVVDQVGMSAGSAFKEGVHLAPLPSDANQSYERKPGGADGSTQDSGSNFDDFQLITPSDPQNLTSDPTPGPSPGPTPSPSISPSPSPTPTTSPSPAPSPTPSASPTPDSTPSPMPSPTPSPSPVPLTKIVISQVYGGGGNSGAPFRNDFIEIFNSGDTTVNLASWSVQYSTATGTTWSVTALTPVSITPGQYYLIQEASGGSSGASLPAPDASGTIAMAATAGKVALVNSTTALTGACPLDNSIVDIVGYGSTANCFGGSGPTAAPGNTTSVSRKSNGCDDTQDNTIDFAAGTPNPRNTMSPASPCSGASSSVLMSGLPRSPWCVLLELALNAKNSFKMGGQGPLNSQNCLR